MGQGPGECRIKKGKFHILRTYFRIVSFSNLASHLKNLRICFVERSCGVMLSIPATSSTAKCHVTRARAPITYCSFMIITVLFPTKLCLTLG